MTSTCGAQLGQEFRRGEPVGDHDVGAGEQPTPPHGDQLGIAGAAADQRDAGVLRLGCPGSAAMTPC